MPSSTPTHKAGYQHDTVASDPDRQRCNSLVAEELEKLSKQLDHRANLLEFFLNGTRQLSLASKLHNDVTSSQ